MTDTASRTVDDSVVAARRAVIDESGWGAPFRFIQVHNFTFWVVVLLFVSGASQTYRGFSSSAQAYTDSFAQGTVWFGLFAILFLWLFSRLDRYSSIPAKAKVVAFLFSGLVSTFAMAAINNDAFRSILAKTISLEFMQVWSAGATAPWSEEIVKMLPVVLLIGLAPRVMRCAFDGLIIGAIAGLGFQVFESVAYVYGSAAANFGQAEYGTKTLFIRTVMSTGHWTWSALCGAGLIYLIGRPAEAPRRAFGIALILWAMFLHWFWDSIGGISGGATWSIGLYIPLTLVCVGSFIWIYRHTVVKERDWARALLAAEVDRGVITAGELDAAVGSRKERKHFVKSQPNHRSTKHVLEATTDLADEIATAYANETPEVEQARAEIARLRG
ncbi:MAG TPA: PrsW family intramembrane metalloprotease [Ilumatobacteraceae bacterium]|nr:PrsW family intramembrane metalloprotease [Ilumatobacteraceae bacterium]